MFFDSLNNKNFFLSSASAIMLPLVFAESAGAQSDISSTSNANLSQVSYEYTVEYAQDTFDRFYESEQYSEAADAGKLVIKLLLDQENHDRLRWGEALAQLASAQRQAGDLDVALQNYAAAIEVIEKEADRLSHRLVEPLWGLSRTYADVGEFDTAAESYKRTLHVYRVNTGLHNLEQGQMLAEMSEVWFQLGDHSRADALQQSYVNLANYRYPGASLEKLPALYSRADMLVRSGSNLKSQEQYRRIIGLIEKVEGSDSLTLLPALYKLSNVFLYHEIMDGYNGPEQARRYLRRAIIITDKHEDATNVQKADARLAMGDFLTIKTADRVAALRKYREAWDFLSADDTDLAERAARFDHPELLSDGPGIGTLAYQDLVLNASSDRDKNGIVIVDYDVNKKGKVENVRVVESIPHGYRDSVVINHLRDAAFRPRFVDRDPVPAPDRRYEIRFSFVEADLPDDSQ